MNRKLSTAELFTVAMAILVPAALLVQANGVNPMTILSKDETYSIGNRSLAFFVAALLATSQSRIVQYLEL